MGLWCGVEGSDGTGKSTLVQYLDEALRSALDAEVNVKHSGPPERDVLEEYATDFEGREDENFVFDRHHLGTCVYAELYRGTDFYGELGVGGFRWVEKFLQARGTRIYVVDQPYPLVKKRLETRGEDYLKPEHVQWVLNRFRIVNNLSVLTPHFVRCPDTFEEMPDFAADLARDAIRYNAAAQPLRAFPSYVGGPAPQVLLVGESRGGKPPYPTEASFMPVGANSARYLWEALGDPYWRVVGAVNALEVSNLRELWNTLYRPQVVALGRTAKAELQRHGIPHGATPHPQWVKRFHNKKQREYGGLIQHVAKTGEDHISWRP